MTLDGEHRYRAPQADVWQRLSDPDVLARATPGLRKLSPTGGDSFHAEFAIKMGPINSTFRGTLRIVDQAVPDRFRLLIEVAGTVGSVNAEAAITLRTEDADTVVTFKGSARLTGLLVRMGQRVLGGVGRMFTKQFFQALEQEIERSPAQESA